MHENHLYSLPICICFNSFHIKNNIKNARFGKEFNSGAFMKANKAGFFIIFYLSFSRITKIYLILLKDFIVFTDDNPKEITTSFCLCQFNEAPRSKLRGILAKANELG